MAVIIEDPEVNDRRAIARLLIEAYEKSFSNRIDIIHMLGELMEEPIPEQKPTFVDAIAVEKPHSSRPGNGRSCRISRCHRAGSGMFLIPPRGPQCAEAIRACLPPGQSPTEKGIKVAVTFTFPRPIFTGTGI